MSEAFKAGRAANWGAYNSERGAVSLCGPPDSFISSRVIPKTARSFGAASIFVRRHRGKSIRVRYTVIFVMVNGYWSDFFVIANYLVR